MKETQSTESRKGISRRTMIAGGSAAALAALGLGYGLRDRYLKTTPDNGGGAKGSQTLTSGYIPILDSVPLIVAYELGYFKELGVKAEKPQLIRGWAPLLEAFESKQILLTHILLPQVVFMKYARNVDVRSVAFNHTNVVAMMLGKGVDSISELGGKVVGCPTWWAPHTGIFQDVIRKAGLVPVVGKEKSELAPREVAFRVLPPPDMPAALKNGSIAGCTVSEPFGAMSELLADATLIKMSGDVWRNHPCCQSVLLQETIAQDRSWAKSVTVAIYKAALWARQNPAELAEILGKDGRGYFPMPVKVVKRALLNDGLETYGPDGTGAVMHTDWGVKRVDFVPYPFRTAFGTTIDMMRRMVVDENAALPPSLQRLTGDEIADTIVDYSLAETGMNSVGGFSAFGLTEGESMPQQYEVLLK